MKQKHASRGVLPPLFDRIIDDPMGMQIPKQFLPPEDLRASIISELSLILNTRCTVRKVIYEDHLENIPLFGLPDFFGLADYSGVEGANSQEWPKMARFIETTIQAAEPRLENVRVSVEKYDSFTQTLSIMVYASVKQTPELKDIHFPLTLTHKSTGPSEG
jgi:type VI secretion system protein ImpF